MIFQFTASDLLAKLQSTEQLQGSLDGLVKQSNRIPLLDRLMPIEQVTERRGSVLIPTKDGNGTIVNVFRDEYDVDTHYIGLSTGKTKDFYIKKHDAARKIPVEFVNSGGRLFGNIIETELRLLKNLLLNNLDKIAIELFSNAIIPSTNTTPKWNATNSTPLDNMLAAVDTLYLNSGWAPAEGEETDLVGITSRSVISTLSRHADFKNRYQGVRINSISMPEVIAIIKEDLGLSELIVVNNIVNNARDGQAPVNEWQCGDFFTIFKKGAAEGDKGFSQMYRMNGESTLVMNPAFQSENGKAITIEGGYNHALLIKDETFAYTIKDIL